MSKKKEETQAVELYTPPLPRPLKDFRKAKKVTQEVRLRATPDGKGQLLSAKAVTVVERRYQVVEMRRAGVLMEDIARELDVGVDVVAKDLREVLSQAINHTSEGTDECRQLAIDRLDGLLNAYYEVATEPLIAEDGQIIPMNMAAAQLVLQIEARRAKLLALDKPEAKGGMETGVREYVGVDMDKV